ncbi:uncharacterized protein LOC120404740 isoform X3 [Mauremys reevesii]|uniref:uncharacterized protein LOC120404740 isoform X3 n=1 Tax=Mauremys reevesii TaxID=260615 RepID=UPI00193FC15E|nr:uncharacterized protein LOC120404740 isoform X3 [Mauremys reevesii]
MRTCPHSSALSGPWFSISFQERNWIFHKLMAILNCRDDRRHILAMAFFIQALHNHYSRSLDTILRGRLTETPTMDKLQHLLEHVHPSLQSKNTQERARAVQTSTALLKFATPCLYLTPPPPSPRQANSCCSWVSIYLTQPMISAGKPGVGYVGFTGSCFRRGVFGELFMEDQKISFLPAGLLAIHHSLLYVSQLLEDEGDITANIMVQLFNIRCLRQVPKALQGLCSVGQH